MVCSRLLLAQSWRSRRQARRYFVAAHLQHWHCFENPVAEKYLGDSVLDEQMRRAAQVLKLVTQLQVAAYPSNGCLRAEWKLPNTSDTKSSDATNRSRIKQDIRENAAKYGLDCKQIECLLRISTLDIDLQTYTTFGVVSWYVQDVERLLQDKSATCLCQRRLHQTTRIYVLQCSHHLCQDCIADVEPCRVCHKACVRSTVLSTILAWSRCNPKQVRRTVFLLVVVLVCAHKICLETNAAQEKENTLITAYSTESASGNSAA